MGSSRPILISEAERKEWEMLRRGIRPIPDDELERCERAALQLRDRLIGIPYYAEKDRESGMRYWRALQANEYPIG